MFKPNGYDGVEAKSFSGGFVKVPVGAYKMGIVNAVETLSSNKNKMLVLSLDIAEGEFKNFYSKLSQKFDSDKLLKYRRVLDDGNGGAYLKGDITIIENCNPGFKFTFDENTLKGKFVGVMLGEEEYIKKQTNETKTSIKPVYLCDIATMGELTPPPLKKLDTSFEEPPPLNSNSPNPEDDMPW